MVFKLCYFLFLKCFLCELFITHRKTPKTEKLSLMTLCKTSTHVIKQDKSQRKLSQHPEALGILFPWSTLISQTLPYLTIYS